MRSPEKWFHHFANAVVGVSGLAYAWVRYFGTPTDEFSVVNHPWQPFFQQLHLVLAPVLVFSLGVVWNSHALKKLMSPGRRPTGLALLGAAMPMVLSGYLIQIVVDPDWRRSWVILHVSSSVFWLVAYMWHLANRRGLRT